MLKHFYYYRCFLLLCLSNILLNFQWLTLRYPRNVIEAATVNSSYRLPVVYVYTVVPRVCKHGLPLYIKTSLEQAIFSQPDCDVILASNFADCSTVGESVKDLPKLIKIDTASVASNRTLTFLKYVIQILFNYCFQISLSRSRQCINGDVSK